MELHPSKNFTIVRQIPDHTDVTTYYVRAVIRNAYTDVILATVNLEDKTGQRFKYDWKIPADPSGEGFYVSIITSVYTDSGYTTKSASYGDDENTYLVIDRLRSTGGQGGGSGPTLRDIKDAVSEIVKNRKPKAFKIPKVEFPEQKTPEMRWGEILNAINTLQSAVDSIPKELVALDPVLEAINDVNDSVNDINLDLSPVVQAVDKTKEAVDQVKEVQKEEKKAMFKYLDDKFKSLPGVVGKVFKEIMSKLNFITSSITYVGDDKPMMHKLHLGEEKIVEKKPKEINIKNLSK